VWWFKQPTLVPFFASPPQTKPQTATRQNKDFCLITQSNLKLNGIANDFGVFEVFD
jgi:hypothetical protein